jgi:putative redox protein
VYRQRRRDPVELALVVRGPDTPPSVAAKRRLNVASIDMDHFVQDARRKAAMKATAHRQATKVFTHTVDIRSHNVLVDEPSDKGGDDDGPSPQELLAASLASCTAITMEMYAKHKGWDIGEVEVAVEYSPAERGCPTKFALELRLPENTTPEQRERLQVIAAKCPVHRTLEGEVMFEDRVTVLDADGHCASKEEPRRRRSILAQT